MDVAPSVIEIEITNTTQLPTFRYPNGELEGTEWNNIGRYDALNLSPYDETILLDCDYIVQNNNPANYFGSDSDFILPKTQLGCNW